MIRKLLLLTAATCMSFVTFGQKISYDVQVRNYIDQFKEFAILEQLRSGVPAAITLAQGVVETAAGSSELCNNARNHFGIKCKNTWLGETYAYTDDAKDECFRKYESALVSYKDHSDFLKSNKRYAGLFLLSPADYSGWAHGLKKCGYATNPKYAQKLIEIIETYNLQDYTYAAIGRTKNNPVLLASADPVSVPGGAIPENKMALATVVNATPASDEWEVTRTSSPAAQKVEEESDGYYQVTQKNGLKGFQARKGDMLLEYAIKNKVRYAKLLEMNDLPDAPLESDMFIYLEKKHKIAENSTHVVGDGETLLQISQQEGMQLGHLRFLNGFKEGEEPLPGTVLNLQSPASAKPEVYAAKTGNEEEVAFGYGARPPGAGNKTEGWVETKQPVREISDAEPEEEHRNIADLTAVEEEARSSTAMPAKNIEPVSDLDRLKAKMDRSVYSTSDNAAPAAEKDYEEAPATLPAYTQSAQRKDPDDALRKHMQQVQKNEADFTPKQNKDQSARVKNMPVAKKTNATTRSKTKKGKIAAKGKSKSKTAAKSKKTTKSGAKSTASKSSKKTSSKKKKR